MTIFDRRRKGHVKISSLASAPSESFIINGRYQNRFRMTSAPNSIIFPDN